MTARKRRQVFARDHHRCAVPGCRASRGLDIHHIVHQEDGGTHELSNLVLLCAGHHMRHHEGTLEIRGRAPDALQITWNLPLDINDEDTDGRSVTFDVHVGMDPDASPH